MECDHNVSELQLEDAFQLFNQLSETLAESYGDLQTQVEHLSCELSKARGERLKQLAEKELIANRLEMLLDTLPAGIVVLDNDGRITQANPVAQDMLGKDPHGQLWHQVARQAFTKDGDELRLNDGRWISISVRSLDAEPGKILVISDITETHTLQAMVSRQQRLTSLGEMIASLAHQIRTPLATALLYLSNLTHPHAKSGDRVHYAEKARDRLHLLERMVNDMLVFARGETADTQCFDAADFIDEFSHSVQPQFVESGAILSIDNQAPGARLCGNRDALIGAFQNLASNAIQACDQRLLLKITLSRADHNHIEVRFSDNGRGMPDEIRERVLEPFFTTRSDGTGLGLAVVNATVFGFNGKLDIQSEPGVGTTISIRLPLAQIDRPLSSGTTDQEQQMRDFSGQADNENEKFSESHQEKEVSL